MMDVFSGHGAPFGGLSTGSVTSGVATVMSNAGFAAFFGRSALLAVISLVTGA